VTSSAGEVTRLNSRVFNFTNTTHNLAPFGALEFPNRNAELRGECNLVDPQRRFSVISGYALDAGVQEDDTGIGYVELLIDRALFSNSKVDCHSSVVEGGLSDCYGLRRLDLQAIFPTLPDTPHSGFRFVLDIGVLVEAFGYTEGHHTLAIRAGDLWGTVRKIAEIPVTFTCDDGSDELAIGEIDRPQPIVLAGGEVTISGWAVDFQGVSAVEILVDGAPKGFATLGLLRPAITALFPGYPDAAAPGWSFQLDTTALANGEHFVGALVTDDLGNDTTLIGDRRFVIGNP
jgi:Big-like domain-containing protein